MDDSNVELILSFVSESRELLDTTEPFLIELQNCQEEMASVNEEVINSIFRAFHSMKGSAGFLNFKNISKVTHEMETLLDLFRRGKAQPSMSHIDILCKACDFIRVVVDHIESSMVDDGFESEAEALVGKLNEIEENNTLPEKNDTEPAHAPVLEVEQNEHIQEFVLENPQESAPETEQGEHTQESPENMTFNLTQDMLGRFVSESSECLESIEQLFIRLQEEPEKSEPIIADAFRSMHSFKGNCGMFGYADLESLAHKTETIIESLREKHAECSRGNVELLLKVVDILRSSLVEISEGGSGKIPTCGVMMQFLDEMIPKISDADKDEPTKPAPSPEKNIVKTETKKLDTTTVQQKKKNVLLGKNVVRRDIRVDLSKLDSLIDLVGELVISSAMVTNCSDLDGYEFDNFERASNQLSKIVRDLQDIAMAVRMIPISATFRKMIRLVHDLSIKSGKKVKLNIEGEETEIDKTVAEFVADPLVHIIRNSLDHGIEGPEERLNAGKEETGIVTLTAKHEGGEVWITVKDDGRGLNKEKILSKGIEKGLVKGDGSDMSDEDIFKLIFEPAFSTAEKITDISGRGVGMDVVKKNIEDKLKGHIDVHSKFGEGSLLVLRIPLTLAIMEGMLVRVGSARYNIPILSIRESIRVDSKQITRTMDGKEIVKIREELIPVVRLHKLHNITPDNDELEKGTLIIIESGQKSTCLFVDEILGQYQTVIKALSSYMTDIVDIKNVSGCTILGNGDISLILDPTGIINSI